MKLIKRIYAFIFGYYWLQCPLCREYFGGFEAHCSARLENWDVCPQCGDWKE